MFFNNENVIKTCGEQCYFFLVINLDLKKILTLVVRVLFPAMLVHGFFHVQKRIHRRRNAVDERLGKQTNEDDKHAGGKQ